jgi:tetratricopeptide (TPR) repeat protein
MNGSTGDLRISYLTVNVQLMKQLLILLIFMASSGYAMAQQERKFIRQGTNEYKSDKYVESEEFYRKALDKDPKSFEAKFNLADALYKQKKIDASLKLLEELEQGEKNPQRLAQIYHNKGNVYFAANKLDESIDNYKKALKQNPNDDQTRYNLIAAQKMKQQQDQNKDQQKQQQQQQKQDQQDQKKDQKQDQQQQQDQNQMSKEDAERLLNAMQQDENELQKDKRKVKAAQNASIEKNW